MNRIFLSMVAAGALSLIGAAGPATLQADTPSSASPDAAVSAGDPPARVGRISFLQGDVTFSTEAGGASEPAALNYPLTVANQLVTADGARAEVQVGSTALRLGPGTSLTFEALDDQSVQARLDRGRLEVAVRDLGPGQDVQVDLQTASISFGAPGRYRVDQQESGPADLVTWSGDAEVTGGQASFHVTAGRSASIPASGPDASLVAAAPAPDDWDQWAADRDRRQDAVASSRYVSREMDGVADLDDYGAWSVLVGLGPVWIPAGIPVGWAPYTLGHWAWIPPWGWTWVDAEPWGFAPFHYGRWILHLGTWCWAPGPLVVRPVFAPALVHWRGGVPTREHPPDPHHVSWTPLRPGQVFHPPYRASWQYVSSINGTARFPGRVPMGRVPAGSIVRPGYARRPPSSSVQPPAYTSRSPAPGGRPPSFSPRPPSFNQGPPAYTRRPPTFNPRPPSFNPQPPSSTGDLLYLWRTRARGRQGGRSPYPWNNYPRDN